MSFVASSIYNVTNSDRERKHMGKPVVHFEIGCKSIPQTEAFYSKLFGWNMSTAGPASMIDTRAPNSGTYRWPACW